MVEMALPSINSIEKTSWSLDDESESAYATVVYFSFENRPSMSDVHSSIVGAKTKVAPLSPMTISRLQLQTAVLGARHSNSI